MHQDSRWGRWSGKRWRGFQRRPGRDRRGRPWTLASVCAHRNVKLLHKIKSFFIYSNKVVRRPGIKPQYLLIILFTYSYTRYFLIQMCLNCPDKMTEIDVVDNVWQTKKLQEKTWLHILFIYLRIGLPFAFSHHIVNRARTKRTLHLHGRDKLKWIQTLQVCTEADQH